MIGIFARVVAIIAILLATHAAAAQYSLSKKDKETIDIAVNDFFKDYKELGEIGLHGKIDKCYKNLAIHPDHNQSVYCTSFDLIAVIVMTNLGKVFHFPPSEFFNMDASLDPLMRVINNIPIDSKTFISKQVFEVAQIRQDILQAYTDEMKPEEINPRIKQLVDGMVDWALKQKK